MEKRAVIEPVRLDILAKEALGTEGDGCFEALLAANRGLAAEGPFAREGRLIAIPEKPTKAATPVINPWD